MSENVAPADLSERFRTALCSNCGQRIVRAVFPNGSVWEHQWSRSARCGHGGLVARPKGTR